MEGSDEGAREVTEESAVSEEPRRESSSKGAGGQRHGTSG